MNEAPALRRLSAVRVGVLKPTGARQERLIARPAVQAPAAAGRLARRVCVHGEARPREGARAGKDNCARVTAGLAVLRAQCGDPLAHAQAGPRRNIAAQRGRPVEDKEVLARLGVEPRDPRDDPAGTR